MEPNGSSVHPFAARSEEVCELSWEQLQVRRFSGEVGAIHSQPDTESATSGPKSTAKDASLVAEDEVVPLLTYW